MSISPEVEAWLKWRQRERSKHRTMTITEYMAWCRGGDAISSSAEANALPCGLTIELGTSAIIGRTNND